MFEGKKSSQQQPQTPPASQTPLSTPAHVYTMPEKFMQPRKTHSKGSKKWIIIIGAVLAVLIILVGIIVYAFQAASVQENQNTNTINSGALDTNEVPVNNATIENENENENANTQVTLNINVNADLGNNINSQLFPNQNVNSGNSNTNSKIPLPDRSDVTNGRDKDRDGLTDVEEELYETRFNLPDTDKDGYVDGTELRNLFSPTEEGETLINSGVVIEYSQKEFGWTIYYPADWIAEPINESKEEVMFASDTVDGEFIEVIVTPNSKKQTAAEWYAGLYTDVDPKDLETVTLGGLEGIMSPDGFTAYAADNNYIIGVVYNFGTKDEVQFRTTFEMMIESFDYTAVKVEEEADAKNSNSNSNTNGSNSNKNTNNSNANSSNANSSNTNNANES